MSSTTTRAGGAGGVLGAALDAGVDAAVAGGVDAGGVDAGGVDAGATPLDVPAVVGVADDDATGADVDVLACLELELHAAAKVASAMKVAARMRNDVNTGLLYVA